METYPIDILKLEYTQLERRIETEKDEYYKIFYSVTLDHIKRAINLLEEDLKNNQ